MHERTTGIIFRVRPLTETSLIIHWLTEDFGRLATVAKGALRPKSQFRGKLDLFYLAQLSFIRSRRSELHTLREVALIDTQSALRRELGWLEQAFYGAALIEQISETETPVPRLFELATDFLKSLPQQPLQPQSVFAFEIKLLTISGLKPSLAKAKLTAGARQVLERLIESDWPAIARLKLTHAQVAELGQFLQGFLIYHLERIPALRAAALGGY